MTGLHGRAERGPRGVTVYLIPGLTSGQRRAVIRRLRQEAGRYVGPALPLPQLAMALGLDRVRSAARTAGAIIRLHPAVTLLPGALVAALMSLFVIASADGPGPATGHRAGLADAVAAGPGVPQVVTEAVVPPRGAASRTELDVGHRTLRVVAQPGTRPGPSYRRSGGWCGWCICSPFLAGQVFAPFPGQLACECSASRPASYTAQVPDPRAFAT